MSSESPCSPFVQIGWCPTAIRQEMPGSDSSFSSQASCAAGSCRAMSEKPSFSRYFRMKAEVSRKTNLALAPSPRTTTRDQYRAGWVQRPEPRFSAA